MKIASTQLVGTALLACELDLDAPSSMRRGLFRGKGERSSTSVCGME